MRGTQDLDLRQFADELRSASEDTAEPAAPPTALVLRQDVARGVPVPVVQDVQLVTGLLRVLDRLLYMGPEGLSIKVHPEETPVLYSNTLQVGSTTGSVELMKEDERRRGVLIFNDSTAIMYLRFSQNASSAVYSIQIAANSSYNVPKEFVGCYMSAAWAAVNGQALVTQFYVESPDRARQSARRLGRTRLLPRLRAL